jgi:hypothetical protein
VHHFSRVLLTFVACAATAAACAQEPPLPKELSGRWAVPNTNATDVFSLEEMAAGTDSTFAAKLTWWTSDRSCVIRSQPISGRLTPTGITFDAKTKCDVAFTVELNRQEKAWAGKGDTTSGRLVVLELKAQ